MDEIEQMEQQDIATTESVFANVDPITSATAEAAAAVISLSNLGAQHFMQTQPPIPTDTTEVIAADDTNVTSLPVNDAGKLDALAVKQDLIVQSGAEEPTEVVEEAAIPAVSETIQLASNIPISANLELSTNLTGTSEDEEALAAAVDENGAPIAASNIDVKCDNIDVNQSMMNVASAVIAADTQSQTLEAVKEWMMAQGVQEQIGVTPSSEERQKSSRRRYTVDFKLMAVDYTKTHSKNETARHFKVHKKQIQEWCKHKDDLSAIKNIIDSGGKVSRGQGRRSPFRASASLRPYSTAIDNAVRDYFIDCTKEGTKVTKRMLQEKAYELHHTRPDGNPNFTGSDGWLTKFVQRHGINLRDGTIDNQLEQEFISQTEPQFGAPEGPEEMVASTGEVDITTDSTTAIGNLETSVETGDQSVDQTRTDISTSLLDSSAASTSTPIRPKRKQYTTEEKEYIANHAREEGVSNTVFKFGIPEETVRHWMKIDFNDYREWKNQVKKKQKGVTKRKNAPGAGRPLRYPREIDNELRDWILQQQTENNPVSDQMLRERAKEVIEPHCPTFKPTTSWLKSFMQRHKLNETTTDGSGAEVFTGEAGQQYMYMDSIDDTYVATDVQTVASQYVTASGVTLLIRQNTEQGDTYDEVTLKEYSMDALKAVIAARLGVPEESINGLLKEKHRKDSNAVWVRVSTDEDVLRLQDDDLITIVTNATINPDM